MILICGLLRRKAPRNDEIQCVIARNAVTKSAVIARNAVTQSCVSLRWACNATRTVIARNAVTKSVVIARNAVTRSVVIARNAVTRQSILSSSCRKSSCCVSAQPLFLTMEHLLSDGALRRLQEKDIRKRLHR